MLWPSSLWSATANSGQLTELRILFILFGIAQAQGGLWKDWFPDSCSLPAASWGALPMVSNWLLFHKAYILNKTYFLKSVSDYDMDLKDPGTDDD